MKKILLLSVAAILLFGITHKFDGQEMNQNHHKLPSGGKAVIERQSKMAQPPFFSMYEPNRWNTDQILPNQHGMKKPIGHRDFRTNTMMTGKTRAQHELSAGVDTAWVRYYASGLASVREEATAIAVDGSGNVYVTGSSENSLSGDDYLTVKYNSSGYQLWVARYNGPGNTRDWACALAVDASGNVYVTGASGLWSYPDFATVKYNSEGVEQWVARYNGPGNSDDRATALAVDAAGNVYVTGTITDVNTWDRDYATVKYNSEGVQQWMARYSGLGISEDEATALAVDAFGNVYVTGRSKGEGSGTKRDFATVKYNSEGVQQWVVRYNGPGNSYDYATALAVDVSGNIYVMGTSGSDYATVKYNSAGVQQWVARYNGPGNSEDEPNDLAVDASGNVYVTGRSVGLDTGADYATIKYNSAGIEQWVARYNGTGNDYDYAKALAVDASGNVYVTGWSDGSGTGRDFATVKYNSVGAEQWVFRYNHNGVGYSNDEAVALAVDGSGNVYITGTSWGSVTKNDFATVKYNSAGVEQWVVRYDGPKTSYDYATALAVDAAGNVYVTGYSEDSGTNRDYATIKYNSEGIQQWVCRYNGPGNSYDEATALALDTSGNAYVTGYSDGSDPGYYDYATVKYNSEGIQQWVARYNGPENELDRANALAVDASGNVYVTGWSDFIDRGITRTSMGGDYATVKYNSAGVQQWVARYNGQVNYGDLATALAVDDSGNVYVTGESGSSSIYPWPSDYATVKYNSEGIQQWVARYNGMGNEFDWANALAVDGAGNVYVTGHSEGSDTRSDYVTIKYNSEGVEQWVARYNGPENEVDMANALAVDASGNVYVTGYSGGSDTGSDYATVKYNSAGVEQWVARYNGPGNSNDGAIALALDTFGSVYVTGYSEGSDTGTDYSTVKYNSEGVEQWIARYHGPENSYDEATALAIDSLGNIYVTGSSGSIYTTIKYVQTPPVSVAKEEPGKPSRYWLAQNYPNPFNPSTTIEFALPKSAFVTLKVYNLLGEAVATLVAEQRTAGIHKLNWDAARGLASGVYLYRLEAGSFVSVKKLILIR